MTIDGLLVNYESYEDGTNFVGHSSIVMPTLTRKTVSVTGAGIAGEITMPVYGQIEQPTIKFNWRNYTAYRSKLTTPGYHNLSAYTAIQNMDVATGAMTLGQWIISVEAQFISDDPGTFAPAAQAGGSTEMAVHRLLAKLNGVEMYCIDMVRGVYRVNGVDYFADLNAVLGKA